MATRKRFSQLWKAHREAQAEDMREKGMYESQIEEWKERTGKTAQELSTEDLLEDDRIRKAALKKLSGK
jgi:hypothetical protein